MGSKTEAFSAFIQPLDKLKIIYHIAVEDYYCKLTQQQISEKLRSIGFKENESKVLLALLRGGEMTASGIARESKIIRNSIYDILKSFVEEGYCNEIETNTILKYRCVDTQIIVDKIEKKFNEQNRMKIDTLNETFQDIEKLYGDDNSASAVDDANQNIELIRGYNKHRTLKFIEIFKKANHSVFGMYRLRGIVSDELNDISAKFIQNGGELRSVYMLNLNFRIVKDGIARTASTDDLVRVCSNFEKAGEQVRLSQSDIPNMAIFDGETVFTNINDKDIPKNKQADIIIRNKSYAKHMTELFNHHWENSMTIEQYKSLKLNLVI